MKEYAYLKQRLLQPTASLHPRSSFTDLPAPLRQFLEAISQPNVSADKIMEYQEEGSLIAKLELV